MGVPETIKAQRTAPVTETISLGSAFHAWDKYFHGIFSKSEGIFGPKNTYFPFQHDSGMKLRA
jgi:hypothetical protein